MSLKPIHFSSIVTESNLAIDFLVEKTSMSASLIKKIMIFGGCFHKKQNLGKKIRLRRAKYILHKGDFIELYFDPKIDFNQQFFPEELMVGKDFSIWFKPTGMHSQGTKYGDGNSLFHHVEKSTTKPCFLIHRLDQEVSGLLLIGHSKEFTGLISKNWNTDLIEKYYEAIVESIYSGEMIITTPLDKLEAKTEIIKKMPMEKGEKLLIKIHTGRLHQIRRHLAGQTFPIVGDKKYGSTIKCQIKLMSTRITFTHPLTNKIFDCVVPKRLKLNDSIIFHHSNDDDFLEHDDES